jgi:hypothetical protein
MSKAVSSTWQGHQEAQLGSSASKSASKSSEKCSTKDENRSMQLATNLLNLLAMRPLETTEIAKALKVIMEGHRLESFKTNDCHNVNHRG